MALNSLMHPRNPFKAKKPDFSLLAEKYKAFREQTTKDSKGRIHIDFKNPACLKVLTWALLKDEYDVDVEIPTDRLIPTIPLRINYILWLEDILSGDSSIRGIDIGTGAVCVYPIIGTRKNGWSFLATEADATNVEYANRNIQQNGIGDKITVLKVNDSASLLDVLHDSDETYDFCMCNPPFYGSNLEAWGVLTTRSSGRSDPSSINTASPVECIHPGGEVEFVREMIITSSLTLKNRVRVYTSMLGKKSSLSKVKEVLKENKITNIGSTEFCQGNTMRWGIAWTFDESVEFPKPPSEMKKTEKPRPPLVICLPSKYDGKTDGFLVSDVVKLVENLLIDLQVSVTKNVQSVDAPGSTSWIVTSYVNTWAHQRRKRRQLAREQPRNIEQVIDNQQKYVFEKCANEEDYEISTKRLKEDGLSGSVSQIGSVTEVCTLYLNGSAINEKSYSASRVKNCSSVEGTISDSLPSCSTKFVPQITEVKAVSVDKNEAVEKSTVKSEAKAYVQAMPLLKCLLTVLPDADFSIAIHLDWITGQNRECMHQLMLYFKNKFR